MALTEISIPKYVSLTGKNNPVAVKLETDNYVLTPGEFANEIFEFSGNPAENDTLEIAWPGNSIIFTFKDNPDNSGLQLQTNIPALGLDLGEWATEYFITKGLLANYTINLNFNVSIIFAGPASAIILFAAKEYGTAYTLTITESVANFDVYTPGQAGADQVLQTNFKIINDLFVEREFGSGNYELIISQGGDPDEDFQAEFIIGNVLNSQLEAEPPAFNQTVISQCSKMAKRYKYRFAEQYGDPATVKKYDIAEEYTYNSWEILGILYYESSLFHWALLGGLDFEKFPANTFLEDYVLHETSRKFLTNQPRIKIINELQQDYLYYWNHQASGTLTLRAKIYFSDGTSVDQLILTKADVIEQVYIFPAGFTQLGIGHVDITKEVSKYELYVVHTETGFSSEFMTYRLDRKYYNNNNYFLFKNSFGAFDILWCNGDYMAKANFEKEESTRSLPVGYSKSDAQSFITSVSSARNYEFNTGWITLEYLNYLHELMESTLVYQVMDGYLKQVKITDKNKDYFDSSDTNKLALKFNVANAFKD